MLRFVLMIQITYVLSARTAVDLTKCKVTFRGTEYVGRKSLTESNETCQHWSSSLQKEAKELTDQVFPDGSKKLALNYCRNPNKADKGPWCYTSNRNLVKDTCDVPFCQITDCRFTGPGSEYMGNIMKSSSGRECRKWRRNKMFKDRAFPDGSAWNAGSKCRNPNGAIFGPWCYVENEDTKRDEEELCDIPLCDEVDPMMYSEASVDYSVFTSFNDSDSLSLGLRLWDEEDWLQGNVTILLSVFDVAANVSDVRRWKSGLEITLSNFGSTINGGNKAESPRILSAVRWTTLEITWSTIDDDFIVQVFRNGDVKPFMIAEADSMDFRFISITGSRSLWNVSDEDCHVHTALDFTRFWLMRKTTFGADVEVFVRAVSNAVLLFRSAPMIKDNQIQLVLEEAAIRIAWFGPDQKYITVKESQWPNLLDFWRWENFRISILKDRLQVYRSQLEDVELIMDVTHPQLSRIMWVSPGSSLTSYWAIYCDPRGTSDPPEAAPPECISSEKDDFNGTQSVTKSGHQCLPWLDDEAIPEEYRKDEFFDRYGGRASCANFCRNLNQDSKGPFCFIRDNSKGFVLEYCYPRSCSVGECKLAGTANDYTGHVNVTRSKRRCQPWTNHVEKPYIEVSYFPDPTLEDAQDFCRNPDKNIGGPWCYTEDRQVSRDFCYVRDCDKPLECTVIASGLKTGHFLYIMPSWRKYGLQFWLKTWNPDIYEGLRIILTSLSGEKSYILVIGDENNEKLTFAYSDADNENRNLVTKTLLHLVPAGRWAGLWLRTDIGHVELGYRGVDNPFFEWTSREDDTTFDPVYLDFGTIQDHWIGVNFRCNECLLERTTSSESNRMYPINLWKKNATNELTSGMVIHLRGLASLGIILMFDPDFGNHITVRLSSNGEKISIWEYKENQSNRKMVEYDTVATFSPDNWTEYSFEFQERRMILTQDKNQVFSWKSRQPLLIYWFSVQVFSGYVSWTANCPPADIDGPPRNGHWGAWLPWTCSVTCGGGQGRTERKCDNPAPNVFGRYCKGNSVYEGRCNTFRCGEISPETRDKVRYHLSSTHSSLEVKSGEEVVLLCNPEAKALILKEANIINVTWTLNGFPCSKIRTRINSDNSLVILKAGERDSGVYLCTAHQSSSSKAVLDVISVVVNRTSPTRKVRNGSKFRLKCNSLALSYIYGDLSQRWEINGTVWKDYGITTLDTTDEDLVEHVTDSHDGIWTCVVAQQDLGFLWKTNWMHLRVISAPNFWTHLTEDEATSPIFGRLGSDAAVKSVFFSILLIAVSAALIPFYFLVRYLIDHKKKA